MMTDPICTGDGFKPCDARATWVRRTQFAGEHPFCDAHARAEKDFGENNSTTGWYSLDPDPNRFVTHVDKPFSVRDFIDKGRAAGQDALGIANDPEAIAALEASKGVTSLAAAAKARDLVETQPIKINHHTREPNQPSEATIVEGDDQHPHDSTWTKNTSWLVKLERRGPGSVFFVMRIDGVIRAQVPFDNLVKAATRIDPDHAVGPERQIRALREETAKAKAEMYDWQAKALQLEEKLRAYEESTKA